MNMKEIHNKFGLRHKETGKIVTYYTDSNGDADGCATQYILDKSSDDQELWFVDIAENAEWVRLNSTEWYNAGHDTPTHYLKPDELEVVEINITIKAEPVDVTIPTPLEYFEAKYSETNPGHLEHLKKLLAEGQISNYSIYDLQEYLRDLPEKENKS